MGRLEGLPSCVGNYLNFIQTKSHILLPKYKNSNSRMIEDNRNSLSKTGKKVLVIGTEIERIAKYGGSLICLTGSLWNALVAGLIANSQKQSDYLKIFLNPLNLPMGNKLDIYLEALPMPPNQKESNTNLDMAFGAIKKRENTEMGICYQENDPVNWVCFVEGKFLSDLSNKTTFNPFRNQMTRVIENLITFQDDSEKEKNSELPENAKSRPEHYIFTLLTPKIFKEEKMKRSRHYAMLFKDYSENKKFVRYLTD